MNIIFSAVPEIFKVGFFWSQICAFSLLCGFTTLSGFAGAVALLIWAFGLVLVIGVVIATIIRAVIIL